MLRHLSRSISHVAPKQFTRQFSVYTGKPEDVVLRTATVVYRPAILNQPIEKWEADMERVLCHDEGDSVQLPLTDKKRFVPDYVQKLLKGDFSDCAKPVLGEDGKYHYRHEDLYTDMTDADIADSDIEWGMQIASDKNSKGGNAESQESFVPLHPITDADMNNDYKSLNRALTEPVFFLVKYKDSPDVWTVPEGERLEDEQMVEAAKRTFNDLFTKPIPFDYHVRLPIAHHVAHESEDKKEMVFFYGASLQKRTYNFANLSDDVVDFAWVTAEEAPEFLKGNPMADVLVKTM